jgi:hypothetical protein
MYLSVLFLYKKAPEKLYFNFTPKGHSYFTGVSRLFSFSHKGSTDIKHSSCRVVLCCCAGVLHLPLATYNSVAETGRRN